MAKTITVPSAELEQLQKRAERLAKEKSYLQLVYSMITRLGETPGLESSAQGIARLVGETIGGSNVFVYYAMDGRFRRVDAFGHMREMETIDDDMARKVFKTGRFSERRHSFHDTKMITAQLAEASTWAAPLAVGDEMLGVLKIEDSTVSTRDAKEQFEAFFTYAALVLKNEIHNYNRVSRINSELLASNEHLVTEINRRDKAERELRQAKRELESRIDERTRALRALSESNQTLMHATDEAQLLRDVCRIVVEIGGYDMAWVGFVEHDEAKSVHPVASAGRDRDYLGHISVSWGTGPNGLGPSGRSIRERKPVTVSDTETDPAYAPWRDEAIRRGFRSTISLPLVTSSGTAIGALAMYSSQANTFGAEEIRLLSELADDLAFGIETLRDRKVREEIEAQVREAARYTRTVIEASLDPIAMVNPDGRITDVNKAAEEIVGLPREVLVGSDFSSQFTDPELASAGLRQVLEQGSARDFPLTLIGLGGRRTDALFNATVYRDEAGEVQGILTVARDVTEWKKTREQLARLGEIVASSQDAIFTKDTSEVITSWNAGAEAQYGYSAADVIGARAEVLAPPGRKSEARDLTRRVGEGERISGFETQRQRKDGSVFDVSLSLSPIRDAAGKIVAISVIGRDITEHKQAEHERAARLKFVESMDEVNRAIQGADDLDQMMGDVLGTVLSLLECDRAYLLYPCDPDSATWTVPMERTRPGRSGAQVVGLEIPMDPDLAQVLRILLDANGPVRFGADTGYPLPQDISERFDIKSAMSIALRPRIGKPWQFGLHQCSYAREWTDEEAELQREIGRRLEDALTSLLIRRELERSEAKYRRLVDTASEGIVVIGPDTVIAFANERVAEMLGYELDEVVGRPVTDFMYEGEGADLEHRMEDRRQGISETYERRFRRKDGEELWVHVSAAPYFDEEHGLSGAMAMFTDITERRRAEEALRKRNEELERFERLVVGRELRMKELKNKIAELEGSQTANGEGDDDES